MHFKEALLTKKDLTLGTLAGFLIGLLFLPVLNAGKPDLFLKINIFVIPFFLICTPLGLLAANIIRKKIAVAWQIAKFGVTGILNALVDLGTLALITWIARNNFAINSEDIIISAIPIITFYSLYKAISFIIANINSYYWNKYWTFQKDEKKGKSNFVQFFIVSAIGFAINVFAASITFKILTIPPAITSSDQAGLIGAIAGSIIGLVWNFIGYKFIVFKK